MYHAHCKLYQGMYVIRFCRVVNKGRKVYVSRCVRMRSLQDKSIVTLTYLGEKRKSWYMSKVS